MVIFDPVLLFTVLISTGFIHSYNHNEFVKAKMMANPSHSTQFLTCDGVIKSSKSVNCKAPLNFDIFCDTTESPNQQFSVNFVLSGPRLDQKVPLYYHNNKPFKNIYLSTEITMQCGPVKTCVNFQENTLYSRKMKTVRFELHHTNCLSMPNSPHLKCQCFGTFPIE